MVIKEMEVQSIKVKCPNCGAVLILKKTAGIENKQLTCPVCKEASPYHAFKQLADKKKEEETVYPYAHGAPSGVSDEEPTGTASDGENYTLGTLRIPGLGEAVRLKVGRNVIGRQANASSADIRIPTGESKRMSREHLVIEVKKVPGKGLVHYASLFKMKSNATFVNGEALEYGDCVVLRSGDVLDLPDVSVRFEIPDADETEL